MIDNKDKAAFACINNENTYLQEGLTKREYFAGLAMQGVLASGELWMSLIDKGISPIKYAMNQADILLKELEEEC